MDFYGILQNAIYDREDESNIEMLKALGDNLMFNNEELELLDVLNELDLSDWEENIEIIEQLNNLSIDKRKSFFAKVFCLSYLMDKLDDFCYPDFENSIFSIISCGGFFAKVCDDEFLNDKEFASTLLNVDGGLFIYFGEDIVLDDNLALLALSNDETKECYSFQAASLEFQSNTDNALEYVRRLLINNTSADILSNLFYKKDGKYSYSDYLAFRYTDEFKRPVQKIWLSADKFITGLCNLSEDFEEAFLNGDLEKEKKSKIKYYSRVDSYFSKKEDY